MTQDEAKVGAVPSSKAEEDGFFAGVGKRIHRFWINSPDEIHNRHRFVFFLVSLCIVVIALELTSYDEDRVDLIKNFSSCILWLVGIYVGGAIAANAQLPSFLTQATRGYGRSSMGSRSNTGADDIKDDVEGRDAAEPVVGRAGLVYDVSATTYGHNAEIQEALKYSRELQAAVDATGLEVALIAAVVSRESMWGFLLRPRGPTGSGDWARRDPAKWQFSMPPDGLGWGRGLMQIDYQHEFAKTGNWQDPGENILYGCRELAGHIAYFGNHHAAESQLGALRAGVAAYNCGRGGVEKALRLGRDVDTFTTGHDYSSDVIKRMEWFKGRLSIDT